MNPEEMQTELSPEEAKASLGVSTMLLDQMLSSQAGAQQEGQNLEEQEEMSPDQIEDERPDEVADIKNEFSSFQKEIKQTIKEEIGGIKKMVEEALSEETETETNNDGQED